VPQYTSSETDRQIDRRTDRQTDRWRYCANIILCSSTIT